MGLQFEDLPIYDKKVGLNLPSLVKAYGVTRKVFSEISGISSSLLSVDKEVSPETRMKLMALVSIYSMLWKLCAGDEQIIKRWLNEPKEEYWSLSPVQFMKIDRENINVVLKNLQSISYGEAMGA